MARNRQMMVVITFGQSAQLHCLLGAKPQTTAWPYGLIHQRCTTQRRLLTHCHRQYRSSCRIQDERSPRFHMVRSPASQSLSTMKWDMKMPMSAITATPHDHFSNREHSAMEREATPLLFAFTTTLPHEVFSTNTVLSPMDQEEELPMFAIALTPHETFSSHQRSALYHGQASTQWATQTVRKYVTYESLQTTSDPSARCFRRFKNFTKLVYAKGNSGTLFRQRTPSQRAGIPTGHKTRFAKPQKQHSRTPSAVPC